MQRLIVLLTAVWRATGMQLADPACSCQQNSISLLRPQGKARGAHTGNKELPEVENLKTQVQVFKNAVLTNDNAVWINGKKQNITYLGCGEGGKAMPNLASCKRVKAAVMLDQGNHDMYWHMTTEIMSRFALMVEQHPEVLDSKDTVFALGEAGSLASKWAQQFGHNISEDRFQGGCFIAEQVFFPPSNGCCDVRAGAVQTMHRFVHENVCKRVSCQPQQFKTLSAVLIKRCHSRVIENSGDIEKALRTSGWNVTVFSDLELPSLSQTCEMFSKADLVLGPHGAGFANTMCLPPWAEVIQIQTSDANNTAIRNLITKLGLRFYELSTEAPYSLPYDGCGTVDVHKVMEAANLAKQSLMSKNKELHVTTASLSRTGFVGVHPWSEATSQRSGKEAPSQPASQRSGKEASSQVTSQGKSVRVSPL